MMDSNELLREYVRTGSETAFRDLVGRYIDLVYSIAFRRTNGDRETARDIIQTVFTDLAQKARSLPAHIMLGGWLHRHTCFVAANIQRREKRRQARELQAVDMNVSGHPAESGWCELAPALDEAVDALDAPDRNAVVLRFFEQRDFRAVGAALGLSEDAAQKRVSRALEKLRKQLVQKGVTLSGAVLAVELSHRSLSSAPAGLAQQVTKQALVIAGSSSSILSTLIHFTSAKSYFALGTATVVLLSMLLVSSNWPSEAPASSEVNPAIAALAASATAPSLSADSEPLMPETASGPKTAADARLVLEIVAADSGAPIPNVPLDFWEWKAASVGRT